jgi:hypothetical protein
MPGFSASGYSLRSIFLEGACAFDAMDAEPSNVVG